jgi:uncharacterized membrane protein
MSWALMLSSPLMIGLTVFSVIQQPPTGTSIQWAAFGYLAVVSMFLGFFAWYRGLAIGPMARVSQVQLIQPVLSICSAALLLREQLTWATILGGLVVILCAGVAVRLSAGKPPAEQKTPVGEDLVADAPTRAPLGSLEQPHFTGQRLLGVHGHPERAPHGGYRDADDRGSGLVA